MNDDSVKKNNNNRGNGEHGVSFASNAPNIFDKLELFTGSDGNGRYWDIQKKNHMYLLRESDLVELQNWICCEIGLDNRSSILELDQISGILNFHTLDKAGNPDDQSVSRRVVRALRYLEKKIAVLEAEKEKMISAKWRTYDVPDDFHDMLLAEVELSSGEKEYYLCVIDENGMMADPESGDDLGWDFECISRWMPFDEFLTWANGGES